VAYGLYGLVHGRRDGSGFIPYCGLIGVGVCSAGYHMTLKYHTQMCKLANHLCHQTSKSHNVPVADELSMHLLTTPLLFRVLTFNKSRQYTRMVAVVLSILFAVVMATHMLMDEFILHAGAFGLAIYLIASRVMKLIPERVPDPQVRANVKRISRFGTSKLI
jgi:dihydroceramidase